MKYLLLASLFLFAACGKKNEFVQPPPPPVTVANPDPGEVTTYRELPATLTGVAEVDIRARVRGFLEKIYFKEGKLVKKGDPLFLIEQEPFEAAVTGAQANLDNAEAALKLAETRLARLKAANARASGAVSQLDVDIGQAEVDQAAAVVSQMEAELEDKQIQLSYTEINAPFDGRISRALVDAGNLVDGSQSTLLATITDDSQVRAFFEVAERKMINFLNIRSLTKSGVVSSGELRNVRLTLAEGSVYEHMGSIDFIDSRVDAATRTASVRAIFPNKEGKLASGLYGLVGYPETYPNKEFPNAVRVPAVSILRDLAGDFVWVVDDEDIVRRRGVETGTTVPREAKSENEVPSRDMIVLKGLEKTDRVVVAGIQRAREGAKVTPQLESEGESKVPLPPGAPQQNPEN